jgi:hypothetical protein
MNLRGGLLIGLWRGYWLAIKLSDEKFRVCRFWTSPVQNVAVGTMQSTRAAAVTPYHVYDGISVRNFGELRDIRALPTIPYGLDENIRSARFKTKDVRFGPLADICAANTDVR